MSDLVATRSGDAVELRFTVSSLTTDGQPLREPTVTGSLCRQVGRGPCVAVDEPQTHAPLAVPRGEAEPVAWTDSLPPALLAGPPRVLAYRVALRNGAGRTAGFSDPVYAISGAAPPVVAGLAAQGTRLGIELTWTRVPDGGEVLLERTEPVSPGPPRKSEPAAAAGHGRPPARAAEPSRKRAEAPGVVWLQAAPGDRNAAATMDSSVQEGVLYRYVAVRRESVTVGGRTLERRSAPSAPVAMAWRDLYPPAKPEGLTALGYQVPAGEQTVPAAAGYAVDLVWQPVNDARLAGYVVYRQTLNAAGQAVGERTRLTTEPVVTPGFHDATARAGERYRYSVTAVDPRGNESAAAEAVVEPARAQ